MKKNSPTGTSILSLDEVIVKMRSWEIDEHKTKREGLVRYINAACCLDIETSTFPVVEDPKKPSDYRSVIYDWVLNFEGYAVKGRSIDDLIFALDVISSRLSLKHSRRLVIYVHNLSYEFQFLHKWYDWETVFARKLRHPMRAVTESGIEFRCSYHLSGYSLAKLGEELGVTVLEKEKYDYSKVRTPITPLSDEEWSYVITDTQMVVDYIRTEIDRNQGRISQIPLTRTSYVRRRLIGSMFAEGYARTSQFLMSGLTVDHNEYLMLKEAFAGGFTHASPYHSGELQHDLFSLDESSAYPAMMASKYFPMTKGVYWKFADQDEMEAVMRSKCVVVKLTFFGLSSLDVADYWLSEHKILCPPRKRRITETYNGRVISCSQCTITITEVDWITFKKFYRWDRMEIGGAWVYERGYLPKPIIRMLGELYTDKTSLKNKKGSEYRYTHSKEDFNSMYGCSVTDILPEVIEFDHRSWIGHRQMTPTESAQELARYNKKYRRTLFYPWGLYVTSWARKVIFDAILEFGLDYHYSDTDSIKGEGWDRHKAWVETYNTRITKEIEHVCKFYDLDPEIFAPKDQEGNVHHLGHFEYEGDLLEFKALRAKCYAHLFRKVGKAQAKFGITIAGVDKEKGGTYLAGLGGVDALEAGITFPASVSGKLTAVYNDVPFECQVTDYLGNTCTVHEKSCCSLIPTEYHLDLKQEIQFKADAAYLVKNGYLESANCDLDVDFSQIL